ncbi:hypothetical protein [Streptomyces sp. NPDC002553]|uniref:hypothetical protein n=1 Tax=Streptomyces sp. NPDC002553 TaxID=3154417 RepID=UPI00333145CB
MPRAARPRSRTATVFQRVRSGDPTALVVGMPVVYDTGAAPASATVQDAAGHDLGATGRSCQAG